MAVDIDSLQIEIEATSSDAAAKIDALATALSNLKSVAKGGVGLTTTTKQLRALSEAAKLINGTNLNSQKIQQFASAMNSLSNIQKASGLSSTINALKKLPDVSASLEKADLGKFATQMNQVASAMRPLATEMQKVANGFSAFPIRIQKIIQSNTGLASSNQKAAKSFGVFGNSITSTIAKFSIYGFTIKQVYGYAKSWVTSATDYIETVNLFQVSMGEFYDEAYDYAMLVNDRLGIDPNEWMRAQGVFMSMANGFGLARQQAYDLSEGLTELAYDLSSLYNEDAEQSVLRLQSALSGEIEPIRRLGISISQATLQEYALAHGIDESVAAMTEQEKALLRSLVLMEGAGRIGAIGDFAKTLESPANSMRVLRQEINQLGRALGTLLLPILVQIIPWVQAFVEVVTDAISSLATFLGFQMPEWDNEDWGQGVTDGAENLEDALGNATEQAKELKSQLIGIDELNVLGSQKKGGIGTGVDSNWAENLEIPNIWDKGLIEQINRQVDEIKPKLEALLNTALLIGGAFLAWKVGTALIPALQTAWELFRFLAGEQLALSEGAAAWVRNLTNVGAMLSKIAGLTLMIGGFALEFSGAKAIGKSDATVVDWIKAAIGAALGIAGSLLLFGTGPLGWTIGIAASITVFVTGVYLGYKERLSELVSEAFFSYGEGSITITAFSDAYADLIGNITRANEKIAESGKAVSTAKDNIDDAIEGFESLSAAVEFGAYDLESKIPEYISLYEQLMDGIKTALDNGYDTIVMGLVGPLGSALGYTEEELNSIMSTLNEAKNGLSGAVESIQQEMESLQSQYESGAISSDDFANQYRALWEELIKYSGQSSEIEQAFSGVANSFAMIDWESADSAKQAFQTISDAASQAKTSVKDSADTLSESLGHYISVLEETGETDAAEILREVLAGVPQMIKSQNEEINSYIVEAYDYMQASMIEGLRAVVSAAQEDYQKLNPLQKFFAGSEGEYIGDAIRTYKDGIFSDLMSEMEAGFEQFGIEGELWAREAIDNIFLSTVWAVSDSQIGGVEIDASGLQNSINLAIDDVLNEAKQRLQNGLGNLGVSVDGTVSFKNTIRNSSNSRYATIPAYANGGLPRTGEMFIARESGPELVGQIGRRAAVANNDQIIDGIASANTGVINAVMAIGAMITKAVNDKETAVMLDGRKVSRGLYQYNQQTNREKGTPIT